MVFYDEAHPFQILTPVIQYFAISIPNAFITAKQRCSLNELSWCRHSFVLFFLPGIFPFDFTTCVYIAIKQTVLSQSEISDRGGEKK